MEYNHTTASIGESSAHEEQCSVSAAAHVLDVDGAQHDLLALAFVAASPIA
jgi:hypothetical protein